MVSLTDLFRRTVTEMYDLSREKRRLNHSNCKMATRTLPPATVAREGRLSPLQLALNNNDLRIALSVLTEFLKTLCLD